MSIDELVSRGEVPAPDVLKIDVEGAELEVLRGMARTLAERKPVIICEVHNTAPQVARWLDEAGYDVRSLESEIPVEHLTWSAHVLATPKPAQS